MTIHHIKARSRVLFAVTLLSWAFSPGTQAEEGQETRFPKPGAIRGSKHDLTHLNERAGAVAMGGLAYTDYENACIYCHLPPGSDGDTKEGQIEGWNRIRPVTKFYELYDSATFDSEARHPNDISLLCLSCHDGTMAVDRVVHTPRVWNSGSELTLHMKMNTNDDLNSCGKCHDGSVAHDIRFKSIGTNLQDEHPISIRYAGLDNDLPGFKAADSIDGFDNGVKLYDGFIECATCHDVHNPDAYMLLRNDEGKLCSTCHNN